MQRSVHRYSLARVQFRFIHESNKLMKTFLYKDEQNDRIEQNDRGPNSVCKEICTGESAYVGQIFGNLVT